MSPSRFFDTIIERFIVGRGNAGAPARGGRGSTAQRGTGTNGTRQNASYTEQFTHLDFQRAEHDAPASHVPSYSSPGVANIAIPILAKISAP